MSRSTLTMAIAVAFLFIAPVAGAKWMSHGSYEPDTKYDTAQYMTQNGPVVGSKTIYFNAFPKSCFLITGSNGCVMNPNSGDLETSIEIPGATRTWAVIMGVWTDCNGDGYVGLAETAAHEYHAAVLATPLNTAGNRCPPTDNGPKTSWTYGSSTNNYNGWVSEFIPIGGRDYVQGKDARVIADDLAVVWAEPGVPDAPVAAPPAVSACRGSYVGPQNDQNQGDAHSVGGMLHVRDCQGQNGFVAAFDTAVTTAGRPDLAFGSDPKNSTSPLNVKFGSEEVKNGNDDNVIIRAQDCGSGHYGPGQTQPGAGDPELVNTGPQSGTLANFKDLTLLRPVPQNPVNTNPASWSVPATVNYTVESSPEVPDTNGGPAETSDCNFDNDPGYDFYGFFEGNPQDARIEGKTATTNLRFGTNQRGSTPWAAGPTGRSGADSNVGLQAAGWGCTASNCPITGWYGGPNPAVTVARVDLDALTVDSPDARYVTFYGFFNTALPALAGHVKPVGGGKFGMGENSCGIATTGVVNNWQCDKNLWYRSADGEKITFPVTSCQENPCTTYLRTVEVGQDIIFRDVDCLDGRVGDTGISTHHAFPRTCERS